MLNKIFKKKGKVDNMEITKDFILKINSLLKNGDEITKIRKLETDGILGCSRSTFRVNAKKLGYVYNKELHQYVKSNEVISSVTQVTPRKKEKITVNKTDKTEIDNINKRLDSLEKMLGEIMKNNNDTKIDFKAVFPLPGDEIVLRSFKVSEQALNEFKGVCKANFPQYKLQDLMSQALWDFAQRHK